MGGGKLVTHHELWVAISAIGILGSNLVSVLSSDKPLFVIWPYFGHTKGKYPPRSIYNRFGGSSHSITAWC